jgi:predicted transcriptional regulator
MTTIQLTLDDPLLQQLDKAALEANLPRAAFIERALTSAIDRQRALRRGASEAAAYEKQPPDEDELGFGPDDDWDDEWNHS